MESIEILDEIDDLTVEHGHEPKQAGTHF